MLNLSVKNKLKSIDDLPTIPAVTSQILNLTRSEKSCAKDLAKLIKIDHSLSTKVLKKVNSAFFSRGKKIINLDRAIVVLGFNTLKNIALSTSIFTSMKNTANTFFNHEDLWEHCIGVAFTADLIVSELKLKNLEDCFVCGLLHDIGKALSSEFFHEDFKIILSEIQFAGCSYYEAENKLLSYNHSEIGAELCRLWNFPDKIISAVEFHHSPEKSPDDDVYSSIIYLANILCKVKKYGFSGDNIIPDLSPIMMNKLNISMKHIQKLLIDMDKKREQFEELIMTMLN